MTSQPIAWTWYGNMKCRFSLSLVLQKMVDESVRPSMVEDVGLSWRSLKVMKRSLLKLIVCRSAGVST